MLYIVGKGASSDGICISSSAASEEPQITFQSKGSGSGDKNCLLYVRPIEIALSQ